LLILDANVVIHLHEFGLWSRLIAACDVHLPRTVVGEADYYEQDGEKRVIDLRPEIDQRRIQIFDVPLPDIIAFRNRFDPPQRPGHFPGRNPAIDRPPAEPASLVVSASLPFEVHNRGRGRCHPGDGFEKAKKISGKRGDPGAHDAFRMAKSGAT